MPHESMEFDGETWEPRKITSAGDLFHLAGFGVSSSREKVP
jgi:hypothetical protein